MKRKSFYTIIAALIAFAGNAWADTDKLLATHGWTKITSVPTASEIGSNYYVFVDATRDLMLGIGKGGQNTKAWYSLALYYRTSVSPTSKDITPMVWTLEADDDGFSMRNLDQPVHLFQTENNAAWYFDTNDVTSPNSWSKVNLAYSDGKWTIENGKYTSNYIGPWNDNNFTNGAECAGNKTTALRGYFHIYAISRAQFKQNLLDNASESNPVDLTPWYVTNPTFDANTDNGWTTSYSANSSNWWGSHAFSNLGSENYQQVAEVKQTLTLPNGKYKVALQGASNKTEESGYVFATHGGTTVIAHFIASTKNKAEESDLSDMQTTLLEMMNGRTYGLVTTTEIEVSSGSLTIGYKNEGGWAWEVFDNFKLYCTGLDLSAYQSQLADLVQDCNDFINSDVVPTACETIISNAITQYNKEYTTPKEYSTAIVALTAVLETYQNNAELQTAYANYNTFKTKIETLKAGQSASSALTTFNTAISNATTAVEAATTAAAIETQIANLRSAGLTYISSVDGQFDITFLASQLYSDWKKTDGSAAGIVADQYLANRPSTIPSFAENFEWTAATTGNVLYQTMSNLPAGYYQVGMYTMALSTSQRDNIDTEATEGDADRSFAFAGDLSDNSSIQRTGMPIKFATAVDFDDLTTLDVNVHLSNAGNLTFGVQKDANGSNWHFAQIASIVYSRNPDLTSLMATRDAFVSEANGLLASDDANLLTETQKQALQDAINTGNAANTFDNLNTVTLTTLPNAINTAKQQIQLIKDNRGLMLAALERFENDYNLADGTDYRRETMSADAWATLITKVNDVSEALDNVSLAAEYGTRCNALISQMDATDASLRLFKSYKAMVEGSTALNIVGSYGDDGNMDTDATEQTAITALNTAFVNYALAQDDPINMGAFLGSNLDFSASEGSALNTENSNNIREVSGWEVEYADADTWAVLQTHQSDNNEKLYMRKNWGSSATTLTAAKEKMLPVGKYTLSLSWNSNMENMTNRSSFKVGNADATTIGESGNKTLTYDFEVTGAAQPFDLVLGFQKTGTGNTPAQLIVDDVVLTYTQPTVTLADSGNDAEGNPTTITANAGKTCNVTLADRTLYKDGSWNTICLPFSMTAEQVTAQLAPAGLMELDTEGYYDASGNCYETTSEGRHMTGLDGTTLYLYFKNATAITAGTPYIIKWNANSGDDLVNPVFRAVTVTNGSPAEIESKDGTVTFKGTYAPTVLYAVSTNLYLGTNNTLYYPADDGLTVNAFRAYFQLSEPAANTARDFILQFGDETATSLHTSLHQRRGAGEGSYDLQGRRITNLNPLSTNHYPRTTIIIQNGKKVVVPAK